MIRNRTILVIEMALIALFAWFGGNAVVKGKFATLFLISAPLPILLVYHLNERMKFRLLLGAILFIPLQMPRLPIPYRFSLSELVVFTLVVVQLALERPGWALLMKLRYMPYIVFALAGFVAALIHGELGSWNIVCLLPFLLMIVANSLVHTPDDALWLIRAALISILGVFFIYLVASLMGSATFRGYTGPDLEFRLASYSISLGPIEYRGFFAIVMGTLAALGVPMTTLLLLRAHSSYLSRFFYGAILVLFLVLLVLTAARGATVAALLSGLLVLVVSRQVLSRRMIAAAVVLTLVVLIWGGSLLSILPQHNLDRLYTLRGGVGSIENFQARMDTLLFTVENTLRNPLGWGFSYLWNQYRIDESIIYSILLSGTGLAGFVGFVLIVVQLFWHFAMRLGNAFTSSQHDLAAIGLGTLVCGLIAGVSTDSVVFYPIHSFVFWAILAAAYSGTRVPSSRSEDQWKPPNESVP